MSDPKTLIFRLTGGLVLLLVVAAFALSYGAVFSLAVSYGLPLWACYVSPLMLDFLVIVGKMDILRRSIDGEKTWYPWTLVILFSGLAVLFNVIHASSEYWKLIFEICRQVFAALPPVVVLLAFHLFISQVKNIVAKKPRQVTKMVPPVVAKSVDVTTKQVATKPIVTDATKAINVADRRAVVLSMLTEGVAVSDIAAQFNVNPRTIARDIKALNGKVKEVVK